MKGLRGLLFASLIFSLAFLSHPSPTVAAVDNSLSTPVVSKKPSQVKKTKRVYRPRHTRRESLEAILLKDLTTGETLVERRADQPMHPASLTKIMSAIVILEEGDLDDAVTVSRHAASTSGTRLRLKAGQVFPLRGLVEAMLIRSANDACLAAAEHVGGNEASFVAKMNAKVEELGLAHTQFMNPCGFSVEGHYSTAEDLADLTEYAMSNETFAAIVRESTAVIRSITPVRSKIFVARTTNRLLGTVDGVVGVKTGYTHAAGRCLITVVRRNDKELLLVLLNSRQRWSTAQSMIDYGLSQRSFLTSSLR